MVPLSCEDARRLLSVYVDGALPDEEFAPLESHLERCAGCDAHVRELFQQDRELGLLLSAPLLEKVAAGVRAVLAASEQGPQFACLDSVSRDEQPVAPRVRRVRRWRSAVLMGAAFAASLAIFIGSMLTWYSDNGSVARLQQIHGKVFVLRNSAGDRIAARPGIDLHRDEGLETLAPDGSAVIRFPDGTRLELGADTVVTRFRDASSSSGKRIELVVGQIIADVAPQPAGRPMIIATTHAEAQVLGTKLVLSQSATSTWMDVEEGSVRLTNVNDRNSLVVNTGESAVAALGTLQRTVAALSIKQSGGADLTPPPIGTEAHPVVLLEAEPNPLSARSPPLHTIVVPGKVVASFGIDYVCARQADVVVSKQGLARTGVTFRYALPPALPAGDYGFQTRYMCGGEPKVCRQTFVVKAGPDAEHLEVRGTFKITNPILTGWKMKLLAGEKPLTLKADDTVLEIHNDGQAAISKVFDVFLLMPHT